MPETERGDEFAEGPIFDAPDLTGEDLDVEGEPIEVSDPTPEPQVVVLVPSWAIEPPAALTDRQATAVWQARSIPWHPAVLSACERLPSFETIELPTPPAPGEVRLASDEGSVPAEHRASCAAEGIPFLAIDPSEDRLDAVARLRSATVPEGEGRAIVQDDGIALDFLALGTVKSALDDLTRAMAHADGLDHESFGREVLAGARAWAEGDDPTAAGRLRAAFELLTQARERFYPVDSHVLDIALLPATPHPGLLADAIEARVAFTLLGSGRAVEGLAEVDPGAMAAFREAVDEGWADLIGGPFEERDEPLLPLESILWQYRRGGEVYRRHLDGRSVETLARRRFGLDPSQPRTARRFAIRYGVHLGFDAGKFPVPREAKRLWEAPDGSTIEALTRPPMAIDRPSEAARLPWRLSATMKDDHVATVPLLRWAGAAGGAYADLRRSARYSPVLARWSTLGDYFHLTDRPWDVFRPKLDEYESPYLSQAIADGDTSPISRRARHARARAAFDALLALDAVASALNPPPAPSPTGEGSEPPSGRFAGLESDLETAGADLSMATEAISTALRERAEALARLVGAVPAASEPAEPPAGHLVFNPAGIARRAVVTLPGAAIDLRASGGLRAAQFTEDGVVGVVDLPAFGFAWISASNDPEAAPTEGSRVVSASGRRIGNESIEVEFDPATGGLRGIRRPGESGPRLAQQLVALGAKSPDGQPIASRMAADPGGFELEYGGPACARAVSRGKLLDASGRPLAGFRQRATVWAGRPLVELEITLSDLDPRLRLDAAGADPWGLAMACRWAWGDSESKLRRLSSLRPEPTSTPRPETAEGFEVGDGNRRSLVVCGGLAHHRREGSRMLDTLLVAGKEEARTFKFAVALDLEHPWQAVVDFLTPCPVVPLREGPPKAGPAGWFFHLDRPSAAVCRVEYLASTITDGRPALAFDILETSGRATRSRLRMFRDPTWARQVDFQGELVVDLSIEGDAVLVDLSPHELARLEVPLGPGPASEPSP